MKQANEVLGVKIAGGLREVSTPWTGASLLIELFCCSGVANVANKVLLAKELAKGVTQSRMVESFVLLSSPGGDCRLYYLVRGETHPG